MNNIERLEAAYKQYVSDLSKWLPEGIMQVNLALLHKLDLLTFEDGQLRQNDALTRYFHVIESPEKITLLNDLFVIWIVPDNVGNKAVTYTLIALNTPPSPQLELAFAVSGVYNTSKLVLRVLEKLLYDIQETEEEMNRIKRSA